MTKTTRVILAFAVSAAFAVSGFAALSDQNAAFGKGPASYLMTKDELAQWKSIQTDADAEAFIAKFWTKRGGQAFKDAFESRVKYADEHYAQPRRKGSMTDPGDRRSLHACCS